MTPTKIVDIAGVTAGAAAALFAIITMVMLGAHLDATNFPGSNLMLAKYTKETGPYHDADLDGQYVATLNGYIVAATPGCNNFVNGTTGLNSHAKNVCIDNTDKEAENIPNMENTPITTWKGWVVAPNCVRSDSNPSECAQFGVYNGFSYCGQITFAFLAIQTILFTVHSCIALKEQATKAIRKVKRNTPMSNKEIFQHSDNMTKIILAVTIIWGIVTTCLFIASMYAFQSLCDKIDTGLGRRVKYHTLTVHACATTGCVSEYWRFFTLFAFTFVIFGIPNLLIAFGFMDVARPEPVAKNENAPFI